MYSMRLLLLVLSALVLQGCIHYHYSYEPSEYAYDGAEDPDFYDDGTPVVDVRFADAAYYPWWSIDYYYFGRHYYRPVYLRNRYFSPSYAYGHGIGPHYWPYYAFYSPFYYPYANFAWYDPWYGWPRYGIGTTIIWTSTDPYPRQSRNIQPSDPGAVTRNVSMTPSVGDTDAGMEIRSRNHRKIRDSHIGPAPVISPARTSRSARVVPAPAPTEPAPIASTPRVIYQAQPAPPRPVSSTPPPASAPSPVAAQPRMIREVKPVQPRPGASLPPAVSSPSPATPSTVDPAPPSHSNDSSRRRN